MEGSRLMELGSNAFTVASHVTLITILFILGYRVLHAKISGLFHLAMDRGLTAAIAIAAMALALERLYYVVARFLVDFGVNLWAMHPAPEALSLVVATGLYGIMIPMILAEASSDLRAWSQVGREFICLVLLWGLIAGALY